MANALHCKFCEFQELHSKQTEKVTILLDSSKFYLQVKQNLFTQKYSEKEINSEISKYLDLLTQSVAFIVFFANLQSFVTSTNRNFLRNRVQKEDADFDSLSMVFN